MKDFSYCSHFFYCNKTKLSISKGELFVKTVVIFICNFKKYVNITFWGFFNSDKQFSKFMIDDEQARPERINIYLYIFIFFI